MHSPKLTCYWTHRQKLDHHPLVVGISKKMYKLCQRVWVCWVGCYCSWFLYLTGQVWNNRKPYIFATKTILMLGP
jgi:hypothetical protein